MNTTEKMQKNCITVSATKDGQDRTVLRKNNFESDNFTSE